MASTHPLTQNQTAIWVDELLFPDTDRYHIGAYYAINGVLNIPFFQAAILRVIGENDAFSIGIQLEGKKVVQRLAKGLEWEVPFYDFSNQPTPKDYCINWMRDCFKKPFDLNQAPLCEFKLLKAGERQYFWLMKAHHLIIDGWGYALFTSKVAAYYNASLGINSPKIKATFDFQAYARTEQAYTNSKNFLQDKAYWLEKFKELPPVLRAAKDLQVTKQKLLPVSKKKLIIKRAIYNQIAQLMKDSNFSIFHFWLGILITYFYRTTRQKQICIGIPILNRSNFREKNTIGLFTGVNPLFLQINADWTFKELLTTIKNTLRQDYRHQRFPIQELLRALNHLTLGEKNLYEVTFSYEKQNLELDLHGVNTQLFPLTSNFDKTPLAVFIREYSETEAVEMDFDFLSAYFPSWEMNYMKNRLEVLITKVLVDIHQPIKLIDLLPIAEKQLMLHDFNQTKADFPREKTLIDLFEEQVDKTPNNIALVFEDKQLTYQQLNEQANRVGHYLRKTYSIKPDDIIALQLERSEWIIIAILGVLKSGAAYLPIAPDAPTARTAFMLKDAKAKVLLTDEATYSTALMQKDIIVVETVEGIKNRKCTNPQLIPIYRDNPHDLAYIIYTSGSTGQPKGVMIEHLNVTRLFFNDKKLFDFKATDVWTLFHFYGFDFSVWEIWGALLFGGRLVIVPKLVTRDPSLFAALLITEQITVLNQVPSTFDQVRLALLQQSKPLNLRYIIFGGAPLLPAILQEWHRTYPTVRLINMYGITETTVHVTFKEITSQEITEGISNIGKPIPTLSCYILDNNGQVAPIGVAGEICVAGDGLARGYLNKSELTAEKFVANPFYSPNSPEGTGQRLYKSGDLGRWLPNGDIEYLGRMDQQLKIRGYRIEAGEIEQVLMAHVAIQSVVVVGSLIGNKPEKELVAYLVCKEKEALPTMENLHTFLSEQLPEYMIPNYFITLDNLPLTDNGKINYKDLPTPNNQQNNTLSLNSSTPYMAARTVTEQRLVVIWETILERTPVGIYDNFFRIGGHSLSAIRLVAAIQKQLAIDSSLSQIFTYPTIAALAEEISKFNPLKSPFLSDIPQIETPVTNPNEVEKHYELSSAQRGLWVLDQLEKQQIAYNMPAVFRVKGKLDTKVLEQSIQLLFQRHEILRTNFIKDFTQQGRGQQLVHPCLNFKLTLKDYTDTTDKIIQASIQTHASYPFNLETDTLLQLELLKIGIDNYLLLFNIHHIIADAWSLKILFKELSTLYTLGLQGMEQPLSVLPALTIQYKDYAAWQNQLLDSELVLPLKDYWLNQLTPKGRQLPVTNLPTDYPRPAIKTYNGANISTSFSLAVLEQLEALSVSQNTTLFMTLVAIVKVLLYRYTGQKDLLIGTPIAGRNHRDLYNQIGFYVNTLVLRNQIDPEDNFLDFLNKVKRTALAAFENELYPYDKLVESLDLPRDASRSPIFDVMIDLQDKEVAKLELGRVEIALETSTSATSKFELTFSFAQTEKGLQLDLIYNTDLFKAESIRRLATHLETLIENVVTNPKDLLDELTILPEPERQLILNNFNDTQVDFSSDKTIIDLFEEQVEKTPNNIAIVFEQTELTFWELNEKVNQVAHYLSFNYAIQPDDIVGIQLGRSEWMVIAILGVMKSGAAYLPIVPDAPIARTSFMLRDANAKVLLTDEVTYSTALKQKDIYPKMLGIEIIQQIKNRKCSNPKPSTLHLNNLAYIIYTSGSTGQPKGVMIEHYSLVNLITSLNNEIFGKYPQTLNNGWSSSYTFDASMQLLFGSLTLGHRLYIIPHALKLEGETFLNYLVKNQIHLLDGTPTFFRTLLNAGLTNTLELSLKHILLGGEILPVALVKDFYANGQLKQAVISNLYGPTEATVDVTCYSINGVSALPVRSIPIGKALANTQIYILNEHQTLSPINVVGELHIAGAGLARGYLNNPELTAEKFIPHPFKTGECLYKTGDLARWLPDGNIEFLGRIDHQLNIRGYRIEAGEIEQALLAHPSIQSVVIIDRQIENSAKIGEEEIQGKELIAYLLAEKIVQSEHPLPDVPTLRSFLAQKLPDYMIPAYFVELKELPLSISGKINRAALPCPEINQLNVGSLYAAPQNEKERLLVSIWTDILRRATISIHDNFFYIGGDSIKAIQITARLAAHNLSLSVRDIFAQPTIATLAPLIRQKRKMYEQESVQGQIPLTAIQQWFFSKYINTLNHFNQAVRLSSLNRLSIPALRNSLQDLVHHHDLLRTTYTPNNGVWEQWTRGAATFELIIKDLRQSNYSEQILSTIATEVQDSFDIKDGPLLKVLLVHTPQQDELILIAHHLVIDGVSWRILMQDLAYCYGQHLANSPVQLPLKTASFKQWANQIQAYAQSKTLLDQSNFWQALLCQRVGVIAVSRPDAANLVAQTALANFQLDKAQTALLQTKVNQAYATEINEVLLTALSRALVHTFGQAAYGITLEGHGREEVLDLDVARTVGWFTTMFPIVLDFKSDLGTHLQITKENLRSIPNKGIGYGILRYLSAEKVPENTAAISFNYLGEFTNNEEQRHFNFSTESTGLSISPKANRPYELEVSGLIIDGKLQLSISYNSARMDGEIMQQLIAAYKEALLEIITHCSQQSIILASPSDFTACDLSLGEYGQFLQRTNLETANISDIYPLSPLQEGMLFHKLLTPDSASYLVQLDLSIKGQLDIKLFKKCWHKLIERHPILRTSFFSHGLNRPLQVVKKQMELPWKYKNISHLAAEQQEQEITAYLKEDRQTGFNLAAESLIRLALFKQNQQYRLIISNHHIIMDGWSLAILLKELIELYEHSAADSIFEQEVAYAPFITWLESKDNEQQAEFWKTYLKGYEEPSRIPYLQKIETETPAEEWGIKLSKEQTSSMQQLAAQAKTSLNTLLQGIWAILLGRYNQQETVVFGMTTSGRSAEVSAIENKTGLFINTIPIKVQIDAQSTFMDLIHRIHKESIDLREQEHYSLAKIQALWEGQGELFDHIMVFENYPIDEILKENNRQLQLSNYQAQESIHYGFGLVVVPNKELSIKLTYYPQAISTDNVKRIVTHLTTLIESVLAHPTALIANLNSLPTAERQLIGTGFNDTKADFPANKTIVDLLEAQVEKTPDNIAVIFEQKKLTYRQLNEKANSVGHYLRTTYNIQPDDVIALQLERSEWMIIAILGVMKAGAAYLPIAPDAPTARTAFMLKDANAKVLLMDEATYLTALKQKDIFPINREIEIINQILLKNEPETRNPKLTTHNSKNLAYVIYTSGSTGQPKGVMIEHQGIVNRLNWMQKNYPIGTQDCILQKTPYTFDVSVWELLWWALQGAKAVLLPPGAEKEPASIIKAIAKHKVTTMHFVPSMLNAFLFHINLHPIKQETKHLRQVFASGEALSVEQVHQFNKRIGKGQTALHNLYGPTEASIDASYFDCQKLGTRTNVPIGKPIDNMKLYILDKNQKMVPIGVAGELGISGIGLARGYLNKPVLTAEKFIPHPFLPPSRGGKQGERLYKTGDLARWLPDGNIEFLGRIDHQLKIRGYRIEAKEIEQALLAHSAIHTAVVMGYQTETTKELVAYLVGNAISKEAFPNEADLRSFLSQRLPDYMIPTYFIKLENLPLTASGKINRTALPIPSANTLDTGRNYVTASNSMERTLVAIWEQLLEKKPIGIQDNFFAIGGHSLSAIRLSGLLTAHFKQDISVPFIFKYPTIAAISKRIETNDTNQNQHGILYNEELTPKIFAFPAFFGLAVGYQALARFCNKNSWYSFDFLETNNRLEIYYEQIKQQQATGPYILFGHSAGGNLAFEMARYLEHKGEIVSDIILGDSGIQLSATIFNFETYLTTIKRRKDIPIAQRNLLKNKIILQQAKERLTCYHDFLNEIKMDIPINANIHNLIAEREKDYFIDHSVFSKNWEVHTNGAYKQYLAQGIHADLFSPPNLSKNAKIVVTILEEIRLKIDQSKPNLLIAIYK